MAKIEITTFSGSRYPQPLQHPHIGPDFMDTIVDAVRLATYETVYAAMTEQHSATDISIAVYQAGARSQSGYALEITVLVASDDRPRIGPPPKPGEPETRPVDIQAVEGFAHDMFVDIQPVIPVNVRYHVWVRAGETGFEDSGFGLAEAVLD